MPNTAYQVSEAAWPRLQAAVLERVIDPGTRAAIAAAQQRNWRDRKWLRTLGRRLGVDVDQVVAGDG